MVQGYYNTVRSVTFLSLSLTMMGSLISAVANTPEECEDGWVYFDDRCYYFSDAEDIESLRGAFQKCFLSDSEPLHILSGRELMFLQSQAKMRTTFAWQLNMLKTPSIRNNSYIRKSVSGNNILYTVDIVNSLNLQASHNTNHGCIALHLTFEDTEITEEPCRLRLRVACQGKASEFDEILDPDQWQEYAFYKGRRWYVHENVVFWRSSQFANYSDAQFICQTKNMTLITDVARMRQSGLWHNSYKRTPFWTGLSFGNNAVQTDLKEVKDVSWYSSFKDSEGILFFLHSGKMLFMKDMNPDHKVLPYICRKKAGQTDCPIVGLRGLSSCYTFNNFFHLTWLEAKKQCEARGAHLLTVESEAERDWLETHVFQASSARRPNILNWSYPANKSYYLTIPTWTSANDLDRDGIFKWHDGSDVNKTIVPWQRAPYTVIASQNDEWYKVSCVYYYPCTQVLVPVSCSDETSYAACQYKPTRSEENCMTQSFKFDGMCYHFNFQRQMFFDECNQYCKSNFDTSMDVITVKSAEFNAHLCTVTTSRGGEIWLSMIFSKARNKWIWQDGSDVDFSLFGLLDEPSSTKTNRSCVTFSKELKAVTTECDNENFYLCEKDLPLGDSASHLLSSVTLLAVSSVVALAARSEI
ncbi:macrophage mannose receptor 1-like [Elysia marginata]|uniref:Macrophage mannose receptor 1-like n=1 Tax=Elysia marginata TaxID=1093978 RepID=A0AAV4IXM5_9GAST|nr:macrophage mannose receptor 1-like [Elysia marginata]